MTVHLAAPLRVGADGGLVALAQDSPVEVGQSVALLAATRLGERVSVPRYGTPDPVFGGADAGVLAAAVDLWEPRASDALIEHVTTGTVEAVTVTLGRE